MNVAHAHQAFIGTVVTGVGRKREVPVSINQDGQVIATLRFTAKHGQSEARYVWKRSTHATFACSTRYEAGEYYTCRTGGEEGLLQEALSVSTDAEVR